MTPETSQTEIISKDEYTKLKSLSQMNKQLEALLQQLTNKKSKYILGNTRFIRSEIDILVINKQIGELVQENMIKYYEKYKKTNKELGENILLAIVNKNCLARWSIESKSKEEIITLGIGTYRQEATAQIGDSLLSKIPLVGRLFR